MEYVLFYRILDYPENGGGDHFAFFDQKSDMTDGINNLLISHKSRFELIKAGEFGREVKYIKKEIVTKFEPE